MSERPLTEASLGPYSLRQRIIRLHARLPGYIIETDDTFRALARRPRVPHDPSVWTTLRVAYVLLDWPAVPRRSGTALCREIADALRCSPVTARQAVQRLSRALEAE